MWKTVELKARARDMLRIHYWKAVLVNLAVVFFSGGFSQAFALRRQQTSSLSSPFLRNYITPFTAGGLIAALLRGFALALVVGIVFDILVAAPVEAGARRFFLRAAQGEAQLANVVYSFGKGRYKNVVVVMFWRGLLIFGSYLLLIIPGIVMSYSYSMVPYILGDNPHISRHRALEISERMTDGHKFNMFVLDMSFIGWFLLGTITFGVGLLFVQPYFYATRAELYLALRKNGLDSAITTSEELCLVPAC